VALSNSYINKHRQLYVPAFYTRLQNIVLDDTIRSHFSMKTLFLSTLS